jgi:hypothetical protein
MKKASVIPVRILLLVTATSAAELCSCTPTRNYPTFSAGRVFQRIVCRASTPGKCTTRAHDVCGEYSIVEPLHQAGDDDPSSLTMTVQCGSLQAPVSSFDAGTDADVSQ